MAWEVTTHPEFDAWLEAQAETVRRGITTGLQALADEGPRLGRPRVDTIYGSAFDNMKELRVKAGGAPYRILFAFDPIRRAVLLLGGDKSRDKRWYKVNIPIADERFREHLAKLEEEIREREKIQGDSPQ
jgi:hypothetical protein